MIDPELVTRKLVLIAEDLAGVQELARRIAACAGLRNRLVHEYDELDPEKVHEALATAVEDVPQYLDAVRSFLDASER